MYSGWDFFFNTDNYISKYILPILEKNSYVKFIITSDLLEYFIININ